MQFSVMQIIYKGTPNQFVSELWWFINNWKPLFTLDCERIESFNTFSRRWWQLQSFQLHAYLEAPRFVLVSFVVRCHDDVIIGYYIMSRYDMWRMWGSNLEGPRSVAYHCEKRSSFIYCIIRSNERDGLRNF